MKESTRRMTVDERVVVDYLRATAASLPHFDAIEVPTERVAEALRTNGRRASAERVLTALGVPSRRLDNRGWRMWCWPPHRADVCPHCGEVTEVRR